MKLLKQLMGRGCTVCGADGRPLLERHPLERISVKGEHDPRRQTASFERFEQPRAAMQSMQRRYAEEAKTAEKSRRACTS